MTHGFLNLYMPSFPTVIIYMLQSTEYQPGAYLRWFWRTADFTNVMQRRSLDPTRAARLLLLAVRLGMATQIIMGFVLLYLGLGRDVVGATAFGSALIIGCPVFWAHFVVLPLLFGKYAITRPAEKRLITESATIFKQHTGVKIAVVGSYGKTTMKELLKTVLGEGLSVAATPANKNVSSSHARFARGLSGDEEVLIIEYGEGAPGDVARFAQTTSPTHAVITGVAPAHLDQYKTLEAAGKDISSVAAYVSAKQLYVNADSPDAKSFIKKAQQQFSNSGALGWKVSHVKVALTGTTFTLKKGTRSLKLQSGLVGRHQVGYLAFVAALAMELGLTNDQVESGIAKTKPFEHRMQPYPLAGGWVVDDTYNGNLEGLRAGTQLLKELDATRKMYVTPGLVDQGAETERVHIEAGTLIAAAKPDVVVLMKNSVTKFIALGLEQAGFTGELRIEENPLDFYTNLSHFIAHGDLVVMQNDWTDNYA